MGQALVQQYQSLQRVEFTDLNGDYAGLTQLLGELLTGILGVNGALPNTGANSEPLTATLSGSALSVTLGGTNQSVFVQGQWADTCPSQTYSIPPPSGSARTDSIAIQYQTIQTNPHAIVLDSDSGPVAGTGYQIAQGIGYAYVTGSTSPPNGYVTFCTISIPSGATVGTDCTITILFETIGALINALVNAGVTSVNGIVGAVGIEGFQGINVTQSGQNVILSASAAAGVTEIIANATALSGNVTLSAGGGIILNVSGNTIQISANPASSFVGMVVAATTGGGSGTTSLSVSLSALGAGTWLVEAECMGVEFPSSGKSAYIQGSGTGFTNQAGGSYSSSAREFYIAGTCAGGVTPSVAYTASSGCTLQPDTTQVTLTIRATRIL